MSAVPEGFTLPWNTTVTMADVWAEQIAAQRKSWREQRARKRAKYTSHSTKIPFAGFDKTDRWGA